MRSSRWLIAGAAVVVVALAALSSAAIAIVTGGIGPRSTAPSGFPRSPAPLAVPPVAASCTVPDLPGAVLDVRLVDMSMAGRAPMMGGGGMMGGSMRVLVSEDHVPAGTVSFRVADTGRLAHELVVLPLADGQRAGERRPGSDGKVDEAGSVGEVSRPCGAGEGDGLDPGTVGWTSLSLAPGRYELLCNLPGHYTAGMFATLIVS